MKHAQKFILSVDCSAGPRWIAQEVRKLLAETFSRVSVRSAKPWNGDAKPAAVTIRRLKSGHWVIYVSGRVLHLRSGFDKLTEARQYLRDRHPNLTNRVTVRR